MALQVIHTSKKLTMSTWADKYLPGEDVNSPSPNCSAKS